MLKFFFAMMFIMFFSAGVFYSKALGGDMGSKRSAGFFKAGEALFSSGFVVGFGLATYFVFFC